MPIIVEGGLDPIATLIPDPAVDYQGLARVHYALAQSSALDMARLAAELLELREREKIGTAWLRESPTRPIPGGFLGEPLGEECRYCGPMRERIEANGYVFHDHSPNCRWLAAKMLLQDIRQDLSAAELELSHAQRTCWKACCNAWVAAKVAQKSANASLASVKGARRS